MKKATASGAIQDRGAVQPDHIRRSWSRCEASGLEGEAPPRIEPLTSHELRSRIEQSEELYRRCRPELETLRRVAVSGEGVAIVADPLGVVLDCVGAEDFARRANQVSLSPGSLWTEQLRGTNGIGAVLMELKPLVVRGSEHFFATNRFLDCAAAPIMTPYGSVAGVLNVSAPASTTSAYALGLVELAIDQIEHRQFAEVFAHHQVVRLHADPQLLGTAREGVLVFNDDLRLVAANRHGLALVDIDWKALGGRSFGELFDVSPEDEPGRYAGRELRSWRGRRLHSGGQEKASPARPLAGLPRFSRASLTTPIYDEATRADIERARKVMESGLPVVVTGETGCGKEVFARHLHALSSRALCPFVAVNCAALPESLIEAELFGYVEGAFTGALKKGAKGLLREADGGVLLLDEIGDMPLPAQARLLRALQEREVTPLGCSKAVPVDFALICATHLKLEDLVASGRFRRDLFYRISQFHVRLKPIREHPQLARVVSNLWSQTTSEDPEYRLAPETLGRLSGYDWPGNFRQLAGVLRTLFVLAERSVEVPCSALPVEILSTPAELRNESSDLQSKTRLILQDALDRHGGNISRAARSLGVSRGTFYRRLLQAQSVAPSEMD
ncbi:sigma-54-dependent Fis family transcriptional regulator [Chenggangzhangella methanolivorans]|uniref:Sigma-54-dependent Fis family transcriptional regulator n=1 Tax=Chenggangzhangella methanolivorans TaxID=1437009 RepID=A0A9E6UQ41_9HYPH|nr:sigma-54-dependent Fis family transcriptional regulator [Chenggangzhangella methanolivorans]QZO02149.1 sigma-54-dependent Fis family transcriptional regulator [Chenggangzhangella methanolivorans]